MIPLKKLNESGGEGSKLSKSEEDIKFWIRAIKERLCEIDRVPGQIRKNREIIEATLSKSPNNSGEALPHTNRDVKARKTIRQEAGNSCDLKKLKKKKKWAIEILKEDGYFIFSVSKRLRGDKNVVWAALTSKNCEGACFAAASEDLKDNKNFVLRVIKKFPHVYEYISGRLRDDKGVTMMAMNESLIKMDYYSAVRIAECAPLRLRKDPKFRMLYERITGKTLFFTGAEHQLLSLMSRH
jgi:hypothetical protein